MSELYLGNTAVIIISMCAVLFLTGLMVFMSGCKKKSAAAWMYYVFAFRCVLYTVLYLKGTIIMDVLFISVIEMFVVSSIIFCINLLPVICYSIFGNIPKFIRRFHRIICK